MKTLIKFTVAMTAMVAVLAAMTPNVEAADPPNVSVTRMTNATWTMSPTALSTVLLPVNYKRHGFWLLPTAAATIGPISSTITGANATNLVVGTGILITNTSASSWIPVEQVGYGIVHFRGSTTSTTTTLTAVELSFEK
jgi:hypothetical protein